MARGARLAVDMGGTSTDLAVERGGHAAPERWTGKGLVGREGARTALLTTEGFHDVRTMGHESRHDHDDLDVVPPEPRCPAAGPPRHPRPRRPPAQGARRATTARALLRSRQIDPPGASRPTGVPA